MSRAAATTSAGARKAAIVLLNLGRERAAQVMNHLSDADLEAISAEIARLESVSPQEAEVVLVELRERMAVRSAAAQGGVDVAEQLLVQSLGHDRAAGIIDRLNGAEQAPFQFLNKCDAAQLASFLAEEHPQVIALVLAHLGADRASAVLSGLSQSQQLDVAHRIAVMQGAAPAVIRRVETTLQRNLATVLQPVETSPAGGVDSLVEIINRSDRATERQIVRSLQDRDPTLADEVRRRMFLFDDIVSLEDRSVQLLLRQVDANDLVLALKGAAEAVRAKVTANLSERAAANLLEEMEIVGAVRVAEVEQARQRIIGTIRLLEDEGQIVVRRGNDDQFVD